MAISDVLSNLSAKRSMIVAAINSKGGALTKASTLAECAQAITELPTEGSDKSESLSFCFALNLANPVLGGYPTSGSEIIMKVENPGITYPGSIKLNI